MLQSTALLMTLLVVIVFISVTLLLLFTRCLHVKETFNICDSNMKSIVLDDQLEQLINQIIKEKQFINSKFLSESIQQGLQKQDFPDYPNFLLTTDEMKLLANIYNNFQNIQKLAIEIIDKDNCGINTEREQKLIQQVEHIGLKLDILPSQIYTVEEVVFKDKRNDNLYVIDGSSSFVNSKIQMPPTRFKILISRNTWSPTYTITKLFIDEVPCILSNHKNVRFELNKRYTLAILNDDKVTGGVNVNELTLKSLKTLYHGFNPKLKNKDERTIDKHNLSCIMNTDNIMTKESRLVNGDFKAFVSENGSLVVKKNIDGQEFTEWTSSTSGENVILILQGDANLVLYDTKEKWKPVWSCCSGWYWDVTDGKTGYRTNAIGYAIPNTKTIVYNNPFYVQLQNNGALVLLNKNGETIWCNKKTC